MAQQFQAGDKVKLKVKKTFATPPDLPAGSLGNVTQKLSTGDSYRVKFDLRPQSIVIFENDLAPATNTLINKKKKKQRTKEGDGSEGG